MLKNILVVEDDHDFAKYILRILSFLKIEVDYTDDPELALEKASKKDYDIIISDIKMPKIDGFEMARIMLKKFKIKSKFIFISGFVDRIIDPEDDFKEISCFISKPFKPEVLLQAIDSIIK